MKRRSFQTRVYWEDTDAGGVVYYANYLKFAERARTEALRSAGLGQSALKDKHGIAFVVRQCAAEFLKPARLDDLLTIETKLRDSGAASLTLAQTIRCGKNVLVEVDVRLGVVNAAFKPTRIPAPVRQALQKAFNS